MSKFSVFSTAASAAVLCLATALPARAADFFPLAAGNVWVYQSHQTGETFTVRVGAPVWMQDGRLYYSLSGYTNDRMLVRLDANGDLVALNEELDRDQLVTSFAVTTVGWWNAPGRGCDLDARTMERRVAYDGPAGRWPDALHIMYRNYSCADTGPLEEQYAENIGMLRRTVNTFLGPRDFDLVYARIGNQVVQTLNRAGFTVSAEPVAARGILRITVRLDLGNSPALRLRFPTAQMYDVVLRGRDGEVLWKWSDGRFFEQSEYLRTISGVWSATIEAPLDGAAAGAVLAEAWLTPAGDQPRFAAALPLPEIVP